MTHIVRNLSGNKRTSACAQSIFTFVFVALSLLERPTCLRAEDGQTGPFLLTSSTLDTKDIEIVARIRLALRQNAQLQPLNLGVQMSGGVASLSGPVPTEELKKRAISIVQRVEGVLSVSAKDLYISTSDRPSRGLTVFIQEERPTQTRSASPGSLSSAVGSFDSRLPARNNQHIPSLTRECTAPAVRAPEAARLTAHPHPTSPSESISVALEQLRRRDTRYQQIRTRVEGTTVFVFPADASSEEAMTFAQAVRRLPGVQHVILSSTPR